MEVPQALLYALPGMLCSKSNQILTKTSKQDEVNGDNLQQQKKVWEKSTYNLSEDLRILFKLKTVFQTSLLLINTKMFKTLKDDKMFV